MPLPPALERSGSAPDLLRLDVDKLQPEPDQNAPAAQADGYTSSSSGGETTPLRNPHHSRHPFLVDSLPTPEASPEFEQRSMRFEAYAEDEEFVEAPTHEDDELDHSPHHRDHHQFHSTPVSRAATPVSPAVSVDSSSFWAPSPTADTAAQSEWAAASSDHASTAAATTPIASHRTRKKMTMLPFSLWEFLKEEIRAQDLDGSQDPKGERVSNFLMVPMQVEQVRGDCLGPVLLWNFGLTNTRDR